MGGSAVGIAGSPGAVEEAASDLDRAGRQFADAADSIASHGRGVTADWVGSASEAAGAAIAVLAARTHVGADVVGAVGPVLREYAAELRAAQGEYEHAAAAAAAWGQAAGVAAGQREAAARLVVDAPRQAAAQETAWVTAQDAEARASAHVAEAGQAMAAALARAQRANEVAAQAVDALTDQLVGMSGPTPVGAVPGPVPLGRGSPAAAVRLGGEGAWLLDDAGGSAEGGGGGLVPWWEHSWDATEEEVSSVAQAVGEATSSVVEYYGEHPDQLGRLMSSGAQVVAGAALTALGAGAEVGGVALDATGIGAALGVPAAVVGAGAIAAGVGLAAAGAGAMEQDLTTMLQEQVPSSGGAASQDQPIATRISPQKQDRHILGGRGYDGGGYFDDPAQAQEVLDHYHSGEATVVQVRKNGDPVIEDETVTGYNNNPGAQYLHQPTHRFVIKGTKSVSVVPTVPGE